jgi:FkbM family methyltransferase
MITWDMVENAAKELQPNFEAAVKNIDKGICLYGAGTFGPLCYDFLKEKGYKVLSFADNSKAKQNTHLCGLNVIDPRSFNDGVLLITNQTYVENMKQTWGGGGIIMAVNSFFAMKNINKFKNIRDHVFRDNESKITLDSLVYEHITGKNQAWADIYTENQYFCLPEFTSSPNEVYVDIGASVGDSIERFIWKNYGLFTKIYGFEPSPREYAAMKNRTERLAREWALNENQINLINAGIAENTQTLNVTINTLHASSFVSGGENNGNSSVKVYSMDDYFGDAPVTFIKADVEGYELKCLRGAERLIKNHKPKIAFCTYHKPEDIFDFIEYISALVPEYKFKLRHHSHIWHETVLYAFI